MPQKKKVENYRNNHTPGVGRGDPTEFNIFGTKFIIFGTDAHLVLNSIFLVLVLIITYNESSIS